MSMDSAAASRAMFTAPRRDDPPAQTPVRETLDYFKRASNSDSYGGIKGMEPWPK